MVGAASRKLGSVRFGKQSLKPEGLFSVVSQTAPLWEQSSRDYKVWESHGVPCGEYSTFFFLSPNPFCQFPQMTLLKQQFRTLLGWIIIKGKNSSSDCCLNPSHQVISKCLFLSLHSLQQDGTTSCSLHSPCTPPLGDDVPSVWSTQTPAPPYGQTRAICPSPAQKVDSQGCPLLLQLEVAHFTSEIPWYLLLAYMSFYLSYGIKHFPPSTMIICTCYPRHYYLGEETVISLFSTTEPITMLGIEVVFNAPLLN